MKIILAPDKFKGSMTAEEVSRIEKYEIMYYNRKKHRRRL